VRDHDRRTVGGFIAPAAESLARRAGAAMWLLPVWTNHERGRPAPAESQADTRADRRAYERESLPLRNLSTHRAPAGRRAGPPIMPSVCARLIPRCLRASSTG